MAQGKCKRKRLRQSKRALFDYGGTRRDPLKIKRCGHNHVVNKTASTSFRRWRLLV